MSINSYLDYSWDSVVYLESTPSYVDDRGSIWSSSWPGSHQDSRLGDFRPCHTKICHNHRGVFRGFHADAKTWKLASCLSGLVYNYVIHPNQQEYRVYPLFSATQSRLLIPPRFYNGFFCAKDSIYLYHLSYVGNYSDVDQQSTLLLEESCCRREFDTMIGELIRSPRDTPSRDAGLPE
jgi:dTDP-4-dehydrorhamnose 3,5-epimerase